MPTSPAAVDAVVNTDADPGVFVFPATAAQRRFWLLDGFQPGGNPALNVSLTLRLDGPLDRAALERALGEIGRRHEALRTVFGLEDGQVCQFVHPAVPEGMEWVFTDPGNAFAGGVLELLSEDARRPFDLSRGPLWRGRLVRVRDREHFLGIVLHHIISDGWSTGVLLRELRALYDAFARGEPSPLEPLALQFADFAEWQAGLPVDGRALGHWGKTLAGPLPVVELPTDRPRAAAPRTVAPAGSENALLPRELTAALAALAAREGVSLFMLYLAGFLALLHRLSGETDLVVSTTAANRPRRETEDLIGLFANPLLLRTDAAGDPTARELLARVRRVALGAFTHAELPFERVAEATRPGRLPVSFLHQPAFAQPAELAGGLRVEPVPGVPAGGALFELIGVVEEEAGGNTRVYFEFNAGLFDAGTIRRWLGHYGTVLAGIAADPDARLSALPILSAAERAELGLSAGGEGASPVGVRARVAATVGSVVARRGRRELRGIAWVGDEEEDAALAGIVARLDAWRGGGGTTTAAVPVGFARRCLALAEACALRSGERLGSLAPPGVAEAPEEAGAALLAGATVVFPRAPGLLAGPPRALADWLTREKITVAALPAAAWNRLADAGHPLPAGMRLVLATEGEPEEGTFGRGAVAAGAVRVVNRLVLGPAGGTVALDGAPLTPGVRVGVLDPRTGEPQPLGVPGELGVGLFGKEAVTATGVLACRHADGGCERLGALGVDPKQARADRELETVFGARRGVRHALAADGVLYLLAATKTPAARRESAEGAPGPVVFLDGFPALSAEGRVDRARLPAPGSDAMVVPTDVPWLTAQHLLLGIWREVLGVENLGLHDDFFALGGNSLAAMRMLARVEAVFGRAVPPAALFSRPTVAVLAEELARPGETVPEVIPIQAAGDRTPLFYLHGDLTGGGLYCRRLSGALGPDQPFYAVPPLDLRGRPVGLSFEAMAAAHWEAIQKVRPHGPYRIGGFCVGGLVAFELARQIVAAGEVVEGLLLIDAEVRTPPLERLRRGVESLGAWRGWDADARLARFTRGYYVRERLRRWRGLPWREQASIALRRLRGQGEQLAGALRGGENAPVADSTDPGWDVPGAFLWAMAGYRAKPFTGPALLLLSTDLAIPNGENPTTRWRGLLPRLAVRPLLGSHLACLTDHVDALGHTIRAWLDGNDDGGAGEAQGEGARSVKG